MPLLATGSTRTILDRTAPEPVDPNAPSWGPANWDRLPLPVFVDIPGDTPGYNGQDWPAGDARLLPSPPGRLDPCNWGGPPNQVWDEWTRTRGRELDFRNQRRGGKSREHPQNRGGEHRDAAPRGPGEQDHGTLPAWCKWDEVMPKWQAWDPRTIRYAKEQMDSRGKKYRNLVGGICLLEHNLDIHMLEGEAEGQEPFVVALCPGLDPVARRRVWRYWALRYMRGDAQQWVECT